MGVRFTSPPLRWSLPGKRLPRYGSRDGCDPRGQLNARRSIMAMHLLCKREVRFNSDAGLHASIHDGRGSAFQAAPSGFDPRCSLYAAVREVRPWLAKSGVGVRISSAAPALYVRLTTLVARASAPWCMTSPKERDKAAHVGHHAYADRSDDPVVNCRCNRLDDGATPSRISVRPRGSHTDGFYLLGLPCDSGRAFPPCSGSQTEVSDASCPRATRGRETVCTPPRSPADRHRSTEPATKVRFLPRRLRDREEAISLGS